VLVMALRILLPVRKLINHDQSMIWSCPERGVSYTPGFMAGFGGRQKRQGDRKTWTHTPTLVYNLKERSCEFGVSLLVFPSGAAASHFAPSTQFRQALRNNQPHSFKLTRCIDQEHNVFIDTSYNGWEQRDTVIRSVPIFRQHPFSILLLNNWEHFSDPEFIDLLLDSRFPICTVFLPPVTSGVCQPLDLQPQLDFKQQQLREVDMWKKDLTKTQEHTTSSGNLKAPTWARQASFTIDILQNLAKDANRYAPLFRQTGYALDPDDTCDDGEYMSHFVGDGVGGPGSILGQMRNIARLNVNPFECTMDELRSAKRSVGRKTPDFGKTTLSYSQQQTQRVKKLLQQVSHEDTQQQRSLPDLLSITRQLAAKLAKVVEVKLGLTAVPKDERPWRQVYYTATQQDIKQLLTPDMVPSAGASYGATDSEARWRHLCSSLVDFNTSCMTQTEEILSFVDG